MDIICAKCGKHFSGIEAAREHRGRCRETSTGEPIHWIPAPKSKITPEEWGKLMKLINPQDMSSTTMPSNLEPMSIKSTNSEGTAEPDVTLPPTTSEKSIETPEKQKNGKNKRNKTTNYKIQYWLIALLLIFALSIIGLGISLFFGVFILIIL